MTATAMVIVAVAIIIGGGDEARLVVLNQQYQTMAECERATAHEPWIVCAETPAWWVNAP